jgi:hypothetical protein
MKLNPAVECMSVRELERTVFDIMTDNGMSDAVADKTIFGMTVRDMQEYISQGQDDIDDEEDEE